MSNKKTNEFLISKALKLRQKTFEAFIEHGEAHLGGSFSMIEMLIALYEVILKDNDKFILSNAHASFPLCLLLKEKGLNPELSTHLEIDPYNGIHCTTGSLGHGLPIATGMALAEKQKQNSKIVVVFIGDGTLGEGVVYESMNIASLLGLPLHIVCENNMYAQSTKIDNSLAGSILERPKAFGIKTFHSNTWDLDNLFKNAQKSVKYARNNSPVFHLVDTYRLNHHSKSDDNRDIVEVEQFSIKEYSQEMKNEISLILCVKPNQINIKGKSTDGLGFLGEKKGIAALAISSLSKNN
jgi:transketolase N-terminal domain/subunit